MEYSEYNRHVRHNYQGYKGNNHSGTEYFYSAQKVVSAQSARNTADEYENSGKCGADIFEKLKKTSGDFTAEHIPVGEQAMVKDHTKNAEASYFVQSVDSFFLSQYITLFKIDIER